MKSKKSKTDIDHSDFYKFIDKLLSPLDMKDASVEAIFVHGWGDLREETIDFVSRIYKKSGARFIVLNGEKEYEIGSPGLDYWAKKLIKRGIQKSSIHSVTPARHTLEEAVGFMNFAGEKKIKSGILVSVPMHIARAFLTNVGVVKKSDLKINLLPMTLKDTDWEKKIVVRGLLNHNPDEHTSRLGKFASELGKVLQYRKNYEDGDKNYCIASIKEGLDYFDSLDIKPR